VVALPAVTRATATTVYAAELGRCPEAKRKSFLLSREFQPLKKREYDSSACLRAVTGKR